MKIIIEHQDITGATSEQFTALMNALQSIAGNTPAEVVQKAEPKTADVPTKKAKTKTEETPKKDAPTKKDESPKVAADTPKKEETVAEPPKAEETPKVEEPPKKDEAEKSFDREAIVKRVKEIAAEGKAEGKPAKIKEILLSYNVERLPDLPDDKLPEFLTKVEAL